LLIGGTGYTGEMKKEFSLKFHITREQDTLPMHCSANVAIKMTQPFSLVCLELGKQLYQQTKKKINW
jgi:ATP-dependent phosphoenolpyruvate carboxykinase